MAESIIFESFTGNVEQSDRLFVRLTCDQEYSTDTVSPLRITIVENLGVLTPLVTIQYVDGIGVYSNIEKFSPNAMFKLYIGNDLNSSIIIPLKFYKNEYGNADAGKADANIFTLHFIHADWDKILKPRRTRAWLNKTVNDIVKDVFSDTSVEFSDPIETTVKIPHAIQANLNNDDYMEWLTNHHKSPFDDHYFFCVDKNNRLIFESMSGIVKKKTADILAGDIPVLRMEGPSEIKPERVEEKEINFGYPTYFMSYRFEEKYVRGVLEGASGVNMGYFNWETGTYEKKTVKIQDTNVIQLADWSPVQESHSVGDYTDYIGVNNGDVDEAYVNISKSVMGIQPVTIYTEAALKASIGDIIELIIPTTLTVPYNIIHSGFYMVGGIEYVANLQGNRQYTMALKLYRSGYEGKELTGYVKTKRGKFA